MKKMFGLIITLEDRKPHTIEVMAESREAAIMLGFDKYPNATHIHAIEAVSNNP